MSSSDTDDDVIISGMLLLAGATEKKNRKANKAKTHKRSVWTYEWIEQRTKQCFNLLRKIPNSTQLTKHRMDEKSFKSLLDKVSHGNTQ